MLPRRAGRKPSQCHVVDEVTVGEPNAIAKTAFFRETEALVEADRTEIRRTNHELDLEGVSV